MCAPSTPGAPAGGAERTAAATTPPTGRPREHAERRVTAPTARRAGPRSLRAFFAPRAVAVIGASRRAHTLGGRLAPILRQHGFGGDVYLVNPSGEPIGGETTYRSVDELPDGVELAVAVVAAPLVGGVLDACGRRGITSAIVLSSGFAERGDAVGAALQADLEAAATRNGITVLGPNCEGLLNVAARAPLTFSPATDLERALRRIPEPGAVAVVSQSGGLGFALFNDGDERGLRFSHVVTTGNEAGVTVLEVLDWLIAGGDSRVICCFIEGVEDTGRLGELARQAVVGGGVLIVAKVGGSEAARRAALAHTAHETGRPGEAEAAVLAAGGVVAVDQEELVDLALAFDRSPRWSRGGVAVVTISGGAGAWAADACADAGLEVPLFDLEVQERLRPLMPPYGSPLNPVDVTAGALASGGLAAPLEIVLGLEGIGAVLLVGSFGGPTQLELEGQALADLARASGKPVVVYSYTRPGHESVARFADVGLAWYSSPRRAARALAALRTS